MKHSRGVDADLANLCEQLGGVLKKRNGELWFEPIGLQLTYRSREAFVAAKRKMERKR